MNNKLMKLTALILVVFMLPLFSALAGDAAEPSATEQSETLAPDTSAPDSGETPAAPSPADYLDAIIGYYDTNPALSSWWDVVALYGADADLSDYALPEWSTETLGETASVTDYAGIIFGLIAAGENVHDIWGRDIADELAKMQDLETGLFGSYPNQQIYSILALDAAKEPYDRDSAINALISTFRSEEGAFGYLPFDSEATPVVTPDVDITALALLVLDETDHSDIIDTAVTYLADSQLENGGYSSWGTENANTLESVIFALSNLDLLEDSRFIKNGRTLSDVLSDYILESGMLTWEKDSNEDNLMATQQGLIAYGDIIAEKSVFHRLKSTQVCSTIKASVRVEGSASAILNVPVTVKGYNLSVLDAIKASLDENSIPYIVEDSDYGAYISSVNGETEGAFGGWDGWMVLLDGTPLSASADTIPLTEGADIVLYYGMFAPDTLIPDYSLSASIFTQSTSFTVTVTSTYFDYTNSKEVTIPIEGVTVELGSDKFTTDENGIATVTPSASGTQTIKIYKDRENSFPAIVRIQPFEISVAEAYTGGGGGYSRPSKKKDIPKAEEKEDISETTPEEPETEPITEIELTYIDKDNISDWAVDGVKKVVAAGLFKGDDSGHINPKGALSRAELATILLRLTDIAERKSPDAKFDDVNPDDWFYSAVCTVFEFGFMNGTGKTSFSPDQSVTREQAAVVLARIFGLTEGESCNYSDASEISDWALVSVSALTETGIMEGSDGAFNPQDILTREMCAVIMARALDFKAAK